MQINFWVHVNVLDLVLGSGFMGVYNCQNSYSEHLISVHFIEFKLYLNLKVAYRLQELSSYSWKSLVGMAEMKNTKIDGWVCCL